MAKGPDWNDVHRANPGAVRDALTEPDIPFDDAPPVRPNGGGEAFFQDWPPDGPSVNAEGPPCKEHKAPIISSAKALQHEVFPPMKYAMKGYVVEGVTILAGRPKIGKSWLALDWNGAMARGGFCFGDLHCIEGPVLYLALEGNKRRLKSRLTKLFGSTEWPENFEYATEWPTAKEGGIAAIRAWVKSRPNARAVTVDVLERFRTRSRSGNENAYAADYETIKELQALASELNIAILVITHLRKGGDGDDPIEKISGTLGLSGGADAFLILDGNSNGQTLYGRGRDLEEFTKAVRFVLDNAGHYIALALDRADDSILAFAAGSWRALIPMPIFIFPADISFIDFDNAHELTNSGLASPARMRWHI